MKRILLLLLPLSITAFDDGSKNPDAPRPTSADYARRTLSYGRWHDRYVMGIKATVDDNVEMRVTLDRMEKKERVKAKN